MKKLKGDNLPIDVPDYRKINHDLLSYNRDYTSSNMLPSYLRHELEK